MSDYIELMFISNLSRAKRLSETEYDLYIREDVNNNKQRVWFYFSVENSLPIENVTFHVVNFSKVRLLYKRGLSPVHKSETQPEW
uniref:Cytosolic carboxypeptidase N-terminal domain-containing protein n=1 Tax=Romanomermis culicivorax TaxID=13658 RepID=A0A915KKC2_ROMCU